MRSLQGGRFSNAAFIRPFDEGRDLPAKVNYESTIVNRHALLIAHNA
jgi:hypothetical protein